MNLWSILFAFIAAIGLIKAGSIPSNSVDPFTERKAVTITEKAAVTFKPSIRIDTGCSPYAAVDSAGRTNRGIAPFFVTLERCDYPPRGTQIYGRSKWHKQLWANMYACYFPKDQPSAGDNMRNYSHVHDWISVVVWLNNPVPPSKITALATSWFVTRYKKHYPPPLDAIDGNTTKFEYRQDPENNFLHNVDVTSNDGGEFQKLIMWEQLTPEAQRALSTTDFGPLNSVPFIDANFDKNLEMAYPLE